MSEAPAQLSLTGTDAALLDPGTEAELGLADLDSRPVATHVEVFTAIHDRLQRELASVDAL